MRAIVIIYFYVALLPSIIHGVRGDESASRTRRDVDERNTAPQQDPVMVRMNQILNTLEEMVDNCGNISRIFKPTRLLSYFSIRIIYEGELFRNGKTVAMKIGPIEQDDLRKEYEMYTYLGAIDNATVENYGIPAVYYYGEWQGCRMLAITLLGKSFDIENDWSVLNGLILFREFVRISKYMNSRGVYHCQSIIENMMFRGNRGFMIRLRRAKKESNVVKYGRKAWEYFLSIMCFSRRLYDDRLKIDWQLINALPDDGLKRVILKFRKATLSADPVDYDEMHDFITEQIRRLPVLEPAMVSWLSNEHRRNALDEWNQHRTPDIRAIANPYTAQFDYTPPNYAHFVDHH